MTAIVWSDVTSVLTPVEQTLVAAFPVPIQTASLAMINAKFDIRLFSLAEADPQLFLVRVYYMAHLLMSGAFGAFGAAAGPVTAEGAGTMSRQYAVMGSGKGDPLIDTTAYGRIYHSLIRGLGGPLSLGGIGGIVL